MARFRVLFFPSIQLCPILEDSLDKSLQGVFNKVFKKRFAIDFLLGLRETGWLCA